MVFGKRRRTVLSAAATCESPITCEMGTAGVDEDHEVKSLLKGREGQTLDSNNKDGCRRPAAPCPRCTVVSLCGTLQRLMHRQRRLFCVSLLLLVYVFFPFSFLWADTRDLRTSPPSDHQNNMKVTAIVMNHGRPDLLRSTTLLPTLVAHPAVRNVRLLHSLATTSFVYPNVTNVDVVASNADWGLAVRFFDCATQVKEEDAWVLFVDDDMEFSASALDDALWYIQQRRRQEQTEANPFLIGPYGRAYHFGTAPWRHGYHTFNLPGRVEVVLTKFLLAPAAVCRAFCQHAAIMNDVVRKSKPLWNGEDIFFNLVSNQLYGAGSRDHRSFDNLAVPSLQVWEAAKEESSSRASTSVSGNMDRLRPWNVGVVNFFNAWWQAQQHAYYRGKFWAIAKKRLSTKAQR